LACVSFPSSRFRVKSLRFFPLSKFLIRALCVPRSMAFSVRVSCSLPPILVFFSPCVFTIRNTFLFFRSLFTLLLAVDESFPLLPVFFCLMSRFPKTPLPFRHPVSSYADGFFRCVSLSPSILGMSPKRRRGPPMASGERLFSRLNSSPTWSYPLSLLDPELSLSNFEFSLAITLPSFPRFPSFPSLY